MFFRLNLYYSHLHPHVAASSPWKPCPKAPYSAVLEYLQSSAGSKHNFQDIKHNFKSKKIKLRTFRFFFRDYTSMIFGYSKVFCASSLNTMLVLVTQLYPTLCDPIDCSSSGSTVHGILQARILEWVAMPSSRGSSDPEIKPGSPALQADSQYNVLFKKCH